MPRRSTAAKLHSEVRQRTVALAVRMTPEESVAIREKARDAGMSVSEFLRCAALGRKTRSTLDSQVINELRRLGGLQKHLFAQGGEAHSLEFASVLAELKNAITRISADAD